MNPDLYWIPGTWRGKLAIATRPRGGDWLEDEAAGWSRSGIDLVVSLLEEEEATQLQLDQEAAAAALHGIEFVNCPIPDRGVPASLPPVLSLLARITDALENGKTVAVHCRQGIGRSGLIAAGALMGYGMGAREAADVVSKSRGVTVPETQVQIDWLHHLPSVIAVESST